MIIARGRVSSACPQGLRVAPDGSTSLARNCRDCGRLGICAAGEIFFRPGRVAEIVGLPPDHVQLEVGDVVEICLSRRRVLLAAAATYGLLLACVGGGVAIVSLAAGIDSDALNACGCVAGFFTGATLLRLISVRHGRVFLPIIRRVDDSHAVSN